MLLVPYYYSVFLFSVRICPSGMRYESGSDDDGTVGAYAGMEMITCLVSLVASYSSGVVARPSVATPPPSS